MTTEREGKGRKLDRFDRRILRELQSDGRITMVELAERVGLSKTPCIQRVKRLAEAGYIRAYTALLSPELLGSGHITFVQVKLRSTTTEALESFNRAVSEMPEVQGCYMIAGGFDYLLKVRTSDIHQFRQLLGERLATLPHIQQTSTFVVMETVKDSHTVQV
ncbi:MAG: Lrp/AsnC ligand binding domain-containing protein [Ectothiorhodospiraceae bacterium]|jgi:Lrp/AsnC family leucine-responsive transcriptional regulator